MKFEDLTKEVQETIMSRFARWDMDGKKAFEDPKIFPEEFSQLEPEEMLKILEFKQISHKYSVSNYPSLRSDINNVILEDIKENQARGKTTMTPEEEEASMEDFLEDIKDGDLDDDGNIDIESLLEKADNNEAILDIIGLSLPIGMIMSGVQVMGKVKNNEIILNDAPTEFVYDTGKKSIKLAVVGTMLASGSPIIVTGTVAVILYRSRKLLENMFKGLYRGVTNPKVVSMLKASGGVIVKTGKVSGKILKKSVDITYNVAKHDKTKIIMKGTVKGVLFSVKAALNSALYIAKFTGKGLSWIANKTTSTIRKRRSK